MNCWNQSLKIIRHSSIIDWTLTNTNHQPTTSTTSSIPLSITTAPSRPVTATATAPIHAMPGGVVAGGRASTATTRISKPRARCATPRPMVPKPTMPTSASKGKGGGRGTRGRVGKWKGKGRWKWFLWGDSWVVIV